MADTQTRAPGPAGPRAEEDLTLQEALHQTREEAKGDGFLTFVPLET